MGFQKLLDPIKLHAVFNVKHFSTIFWEESVYIQYQTLFFCMYYESDCGTHIHSKWCLTAKPAALYAVGLPGGKVPKMCLIYVYVYVYIYTEEM